ADIDAFGNGWPCEPLARFEEMLDFTEYPWVAYRCAPNHDAIHFVLHAPGRGLLHAVDISIAKNGNTNPRITLYIAYHAPVRLTFIHLRARASVDTERLDAHVLQALGYFVHVFGVVVPAEACFNRHGQVGGFNHGFRHGRHLVNVLKQARPRTTASHVFNGAAVVDINQVGV